MIAEQQRNIEALCQTADQLKELISPSAHDVLARLDGLYAEAMALSEDRVLRIVGTLLAQHGLGLLFEQAYAAVLEGAVVEYGDGLRFLRRQLHVEQVA